MDIAKRTAQMSRAVRAKVGAVVVKDDKVISLSWNGTPAGWDNECEYKSYCLSKDINGTYFPGTETEYPYRDEQGRYKLVTKSEVLHAERNALDKLAKGNEGGDGAVLFVTHSPCLECAKSIYGAGIKEVYYSEDYRLNEGVYFLEKCGIRVSKVN